MKKKLFCAIIAMGGIFPFVARAHCPLCTAGAGAAAIGAAWLGINSVAIGIFIGAFGLATGIWFSRLLKMKLKKTFLYQDEIIGIASWFLTVLPMRPMLSSYNSFNLYWIGEYGGLLNRTYMYNYFIIGAVIGAVLLFVAPMLSTWLRKKRGKQIPYQGMVITFGLLFFAAIVSEIVL